MPFQPGNTYGRRVRQIEHTMRWLIDQAEHRHKVRDACLAVLDRAAGGDLQSFQVLRDTIDGKPTQRIEADMGDTRELALADVVQAVLAARAASATDAHVQVETDPLQVEHAAPLLQVADPPQVSEHLPSPLEGK